MNVVLSVAGSDSIGGAGLQADLKAIAAMDMHGACVVTAITAQNTQRVAKIKAVPTSDINAQLNAVLDDAKVEAVKTGMLYSPAVPRLLERKLKGAGIPLVVDPVLIAGVGDKLYSEGLVQVMKERLFPLATVVTPNRHEAEVLSSMTIDDPETARRACLAIAELGPEAVLLKGGHFEGDDVIDVLYHDGKTYEFTAPRSKNKVHGAGCTVASFLACNLARGMAVKEASLDAKRRITDSIAMGYPVGKGVMVINPLATKQKEAMRMEVQNGLRMAADEIGKRLPAEALMEDGLEMVYSLPSPQGFNDVCGAMHDPRCDRTSASFGAAREVSRELLKMNRASPEIRSAILLKGTEKIMERLGLERRVKQTGLVFVLPSSSRGMGHESTICVVGRDPEELLATLRPILQ
ncbi:MAG: Bifunctional thiamine biosynthesis protein ThiDN [Methanomassiliicoccales archaeon PtaU1.Bin124]|nr:MAG: Bifunctional thiamine biosynthesis protein ThiDN [Methanomassiliicoccales archaeon PtaU1.Bin124]